MIPFYIHTIWFPYVYGCILRIRMENPIFFNHIENSTIVDQLKRMEADLAQLPRIQADLAQLPIIQADLSELKSDVARRTPGTNCIILDRVF